MLCREICLSWIQISFCQTIHRILFPDNSMQKPSLAAFLHTMFIQGTGSLYPLDPSALCPELSVPPFIPRTIPFRKTVFINTPPKKMLENAVFPKSIPQFITNCNYTSYGNTIFQQSLFYISVQPSIAPALY